MRKALFVFLFTCSSFLAMSQDFPGDYWHKGYVVLMSGDTVKGSIKYDLENNLIQLQTKKNMRTYSARKILFFEIQDALNGNYRIFYALPYNTTSNYKTPVLFEVLVEGPTSLLVREKLKNETINSSPYYPSMSYSRVVLVYDMYFLDLKGGISSYSGKKNDLLRYFARRENEIKEYMKLNRLSHDEVRDVIRITAYYNTLLEQ